VRYAPNQTPDNVQGNDFFGSEFYRIKEALRNLEVDGLTVYKGSPAKVAFIVNDSGIGVTDTIGASPIIEFFNSTPVRTGFLRFTDTVGTLEQTNGNSGQLTLSSKDAGGTARSLEWQAVNGIIKGFAKEVIRTGDAFLRLNQNADFASGVFTPGVLRADGGLQTLLIARADGGIDLGNAVGRLRLGATRGSINVIDAVGGWYGYQMNARVAVLHDGVNAFEIRDMVNSKTLFGATLAAESSLWHNNVQTVKTAISNLLVTDGTVFRKAIFDSGQITISVSTATSVTHGLGYIPGTVCSFLECTTADAGYAIGDRVAMPITMSTATAAGIMCWWNSTNMGYARNTTIQLGHKTTSVATTITLTSWRLRFIVAY
jgi:hypothetical protein